MICLYNVQLSDFLNKRGQKGQAFRNPLGREVTMYMAQNSPCLFFYSLSHNVYWSFNNKQSWLDEVWQQVIRGSVQDWIASADSVVYLHMLSVCCFSIWYTKGFMPTRYQRKHTHKISANNNLHGTIPHLVDQFWVLDCGYSWPPQYLWKWML